MMYVSMILFNYATLLCGSLALIALLDTPKNTTFLLLDQPSREVSATSIPITGKNEITINANTTNLKAT
jgi:hypothetical protein